MKLKFFSQVSLISIITTLMMAQVSIAKPNFLFDEREDVRDRFEETRDNREDRFDEREDVRDRFEETRDNREDRFDERKDVRDRPNSLASGDRVFSNFPPKQVPFPKRP